MKYHTWKDGPYKEALQALVKFLTKKEVSDPLTLTFQQDDDADAVDDDTYLAHSRRQRREDIEEHKDTRFHHGYKICLIFLALARHHLKNARGIVHSRRFIAI